ncbi:GNAT family N-acetyltransferase [bacterium]|nr:GNAT family N-acetyltransferase [bacterium]
MYGAEAEFILLIYAFRMLNMHKVSGRIAEFAIEAQKLVLDIGFVKEATLRKMFYQNGRYWDLDIYGLLYKEFEDFLNTPKGQKYYSSSQKNLKNSHTN